MKSSHFLLPVLFLVGSLSVWAQSNAIDVDNAIQKLRAENAALEDSMPDQKAVLTLLRQQNVALKARINGPQTVAEVKAAAMTALGVTAAMGAGGISNGVAWLQAMGDVDNPHHVLVMKSLTARDGTRRIGIVIGDAAAALAKLPDTTDAAENAARKALAAKIASAQQMLATIAANARQPSEDWRFPFRDLLAALK